MAHWEQTRDAILALWGSDCFDLKFPDTASISAWPDESEHNNDEAQGTAANQPTPVSSGHGPNSRAYIDFNSAAPDYYEKSSGAAGLSADDDAPYFLCVFSESQAGAFLTLCDYADSTGTSATVARLRDAGSNNTLRFVGTAKNQGGTAEASTTTTVSNNIATVHIFEGWFDEADGLLHVRLDGAGEGTVDVADTGGLVEVANTLDKIRTGLGWTGALGFHGRMGVKFAGKNSTDSRRDQTLALVRAFYSGLWPSGIASAEAFGTPTITTGAVSVSPSSIASAEAFGTATITRGAVTVAPSSIASAEAFGSPTIHQTLAPSSIGSAETFGTPSISAGAVTVSPSSIGSAEAFGTATVARGAVVLSPSSIASAEAFGSASIAKTVAPSSIASAEAFGALSFTFGAVTLSPTGIASAEAFGTPVVNFAGQLRHSIRRVIARAPNRRVIARAPNRRTTARAST